MTLSPARRLLSSSSSAALFRSLSQPSSHSSPLTAWRPDIVRIYPAPPSKLFFGFSSPGQRFYQSLARGPSFCAEKALFCDFAPRIASSFLTNGRNALLRGRIQQQWFATSRSGMPGRVDLGARARRNQARRLWSLALTFTFIAGFIVVVLYNFQDSLVFYITPTEALEKFYKDPSKTRCRLGGLVLEGSILHSTDSAEMEFVVTDLANDLLVRFKGTLPDLFREGHSVVAEGFIRPMSSKPDKSCPEDSATNLNKSVTRKAREAGCYFAAIEVLAKHDEKYMPKEVAAALEKNRAAQAAAHAALAVSSGGDTA